MNSLHPIVKRSAELVHERIDIDGLLLFGSYARGDFTDDSDIDFVTLGTKFQRTIIDDSKPQIDAWTHTADRYLAILDGKVTQPFEESLFLGILQESTLIHDDKETIFSRARTAATSWSWPKEVQLMLSTRLVETYALRPTSSRSSKHVRNHIEQRIGLYSWNQPRATQGLPLLRRLKDIYKKDTKARIGSITTESSSEERSDLQTQFVNLAEQVLTDAKRQPFTEIKDTIKAYHASRFNEWILSMADSLIFLAAMGMANRGHPPSWKLLDVASEVKMLKDTRKRWKEYRKLHDRFNEFLEI
ncbi:MAG: nucleotidyltransferase domain-containing protein [Candidatus Thorarchaeota archaeon]